MNQEKNKTSSAAERDLQRIVFVPVIHTDAESAERVRRIVRETMPDVVAVELDRERYEIMMSGAQVQHDHPSSGDPVEALMSQIAALEHTLGGHMGSDVGAEMMAAIEEGREIGAKIALVDRPLRDTVQALMRVPLDEIYRLMGVIPETTEEIVSGDLDQHLDSLRSAEGVTELMTQFREEFPGITRALIDQRDEYVARALMTILGDVEGKIVVVLGAGHVEGVKRHLRRLLKQQGHAA